MRTPTALPTNNFETIYQAALAQDPSLLPVGTYCIDEFRPGMYGMSAAAKLASEGEETAANWLIRQAGAHISWVAQGAALGGHETFARQLITEGADINRVAFGAAQGGHKTFARQLMTEGANINWVAQGAALGGHEIFARQLITEGTDIHRVAFGAALGGHETFARQLMTEGADINWVAFGAALGGHEIFARQLITEGANINWAAEGAALGGHETFARQLITEGADINWVAQGAALGGHETFARQLITEGADINRLAQAAPQGGHETFARQLITEGADINRVAQGAALAGHETFARQLITEGADINRVAQAAALGGHETFARQLITEGANINRVAQAAAQVGDEDFARQLITEGADINRVAQATAVAGHLHYQSAKLRFLSNLNRKNRNKMVKALSKLENPIHIEPSVLKRANRIEKLMNAYGYSYRLALLSTRQARAYTLTLDNENSLQLTPTNTRHSNHGARLLFAAFICFKNPAIRQLPLSNELLWKIMEYVFRTKLSGQESEALAFLTMRSIACKSIENYKSNLWFYQGDKKDRAETFKQAVRNSNPNTLFTVMTQYNEHIDPSVREIATSWSARLVSSS